MSKIKAYLEDGETETDLLNHLSKVIHFNTKGKSEDFQDPAMDNVLQHLENMHTEVMDELFSDIADLLKNK